MLLLLLGGHELFGQFGQLFGVELMECMVVVGIGGMVVERELAGRRGRGRWLGGRCLF